MAHANGGEIESETRACLVYCRVSTSRQSSNIGKDGQEKESDLDRQIERMKAEATNRYPELPCHVYQETGSGMNYERKILNRLLDEVLEGKWDNSVLLVENRDRLVRFAEPMVAKILSSKGIQIIYTAQEDNSADQDFSADILACIHYFSTKFYSSRSTEKSKRILPPSVIQRAKELMDNGVSVRNIVEILDKENVRAAGGEKIHYNVLLRLYHSQAKIEAVIPKIESSIAEWEKLFIERADSSHVLPFQRAYLEYEKWAKSARKVVMSSQRFFRRFNRIEHGSVNINGKTIRGWRGLIIKGQSCHVVAKRIEKGGAGDLLLTFTAQMKNERATQSEIYRRYKQFCRARAVRPLSLSKTIYIMSALGWKTVNSETKKKLFMRA